MDPVDPFSRPDVSNLRCSVDNIIKTVRPAFVNIDALKGRSLVLCLGTTGCGKSTMLNGLLYGVETL